MKQDRVTQIFCKYLYIYFFYPAIATYLAVILGIRLPAILELVPALIMFFYFKRYGTISIVDLSSILFITSLLMFLYNNSISQWIGNYEIRGMIFFIINYLIFRIVLPDNSSHEVSRTIIKILKFSMIIALSEFVLINYNDLYINIQDRYLAAYPEKERLYEYILGYAKPIGLFPGTHNAGIASTILILSILLLKNIKNNSLFLIASLIVFILCFSVSNLVTLFAVALVFFIINKNNNLLNKIVLLSIIFIFIIFILTYYGEISNFRTSGFYEYQENNGFLDSIYNKNIISTINYLISNPFGLEIDRTDFFNNEVYFSRVAIYFGIPMMIFWFTISCAMLIKLRKKNLEIKFFIIGYFSLLISSLHYPSIISYPLNIIVPLSWLYVFNSKNNMAI